MVRKLLITLLFLAIIIRPSIEVFINLHTYSNNTYDQRYEGLKSLYYSSQYTVKNNPKIITDEALEAFAAGIFLKGLNPIFIVHDQPPLGRYIIAFSIVLFNNEKTITPLVFGISLLGLYLISRKVIKDNLVSLIPIVFFANEPIMFSKLSYTPLLEPIQFPFIIFSIYFFIKYVESKKIVWAVFSVLCLGGVISVRFFILGIFLLISQVAFLVIRKKIVLLLKFLMVLPLSLVILLLSYTRSIQDSGSILEPLRIQKYILHYHGSKFVQIGTVWDLLLFNKWHTWWGDRSISSDPNWNIVWPISTVFSILLGFLGLFKKIKLSDPELILLLWLGFYLLMLSSGSVSVRYFLPLLPFLYILSIALLYRIKKVKNLIKKL